MIIAHNNKIVNMFIEDSIAKKEDSVLVNASQNSSSDGNSSYSMYYDTTYMAIALSYDIRVIESYSNKEDDSIRYVLLFDNLRDCEKAARLLKKKNKQYQKITLLSIKEDIVLFYLSKLFKETYYRNFKNELIARIYKYILYKSKVNYEIAKIASLRTIKEVKDYTTLQFRVTPNNFARNVLDKANTREVYEFVYNNKSNINYLIAILFSYVENCLKVYKVIKDNNLTMGTLGKFYTEDKQIAEYYTFAEFKQYYKTSQSYEYLYLIKLHEKLKQARSRIEKQLVILELIT